MPKARITDPQTSHDAAESVTNLTQTKRLILQVLETGAMSDEQLVNAFDTGTRVFGYPRVSESGLRSRRAELVRDGLVVDSGTRVKMASGRNAIVWSVA